MPLSMTTNAVTVAYIVIELALEFARDQFPINGGRQIRSLEPLREGGGELMGGALLGLVGLRVRLFICACVKFALVVSVLVILLVSRVLGLVLVSSSKSVIEVKGFREMNGCGQSGIFDESSAS
jgi:hypothetical protein